MKVLSALKMICFLFLLPLTVFSEQERPSLGLEGMIHSFSCEQIRKEISFEMKVPIHVEYSYPIFFGKGALIEYVNKQIKTESEDRFDCLVKEEVFSEEVYDDDCLLSYNLFPVYQTPNLISILGCDFQGRGCHGCTYYEGKTFWQNGKSIVKLALDDLFVKGREYRWFLIKYCENYFKDSCYGYYSSDSELLPQLQSDDLDIFTLTDQGLMIVFRAYKVGGWADGPDQVLIPYRKLKEFIDPFGPLKEVLE